MQSVYPLSYCCVVFIIKRTYICNQLVDNGMKGLALLENVHKIIFIITHLHIDYNLILFNFVIFRIVITILEHPSGETLANVECLLLHQLGY